MRVCPAVRKALSDAPTVLQVGSPRLVATGPPDAPRWAGVRQDDVNWLLDPRLVEARLRWHKGLLNIAGLSEHIGELEEMWNRLSCMSEQHALLANMTGLLQARQEAAAASDELRLTLHKAESALNISFCGFMKTSAEIIAASEAAASVLTEMMTGSSSLDQMWTMPFPPGIFH